MILRQMRDYEGQKRWQLDTSFIGSKKHMGNTCVPQTALGTVSFLFFLVVVVDSAQFLQYTTCPPIVCVGLTWARCQTHPKAGPSLS